MTSIDAFAAIAPFALWATSTISFRTAMCLSVGGLLYRRFTTTVDPEAKAKKESLKAARLAVFKKGLMERGYKSVQIGEKRGNPAEIFFRIYKAEEKKESKGKIFCLSGMGTRGDIWDKQVNHFTAAGFDVLTMDNRGAGESSDKSTLSFGRYSITMLAYDAMEVLEHLKWDRDIHVLGISMGGMIAQELALTMTGKISSLTLLSTHPGGKILPQIGTFEGAKGLLKLMLGKSKDSLEHSTKKYNLLIGPKMKTDKERYGQAIADAARKRDLFGAGLLTPAGSIGQLTAVMTHRTRNRLGQIADSKISCLVVHGTHDKIVDPRHADTLHQLLKCEKVMLKEVGHAPIYEEIDTIVNLTLKNIRATMTTL